MTDKDRFIRKLWLLSLVIISIGNLIYSYSQQMSDTSNSQNIFMLAVSGITVFIWIFVYYMCAYRKPGTRLLTFTLFMVPLSLAINAMLVTSKIIPLEKSGLYPLQLILAIWMYILTWKMRKINKKLQKD